MSEWLLDAATPTSQDYNEAHLNHVLLAEHKDRILELANRISHNDGRDQSWTFEEVMADEEMLGRVLALDEELVLKNYGASLPDTQRDRITELANQIRQEDGKLRVLAFDEIIIDGPLLKRVFAHDESLKSVRLGLQRAKSTTILSKAYQGVVAKDEFVNLHTKPGKYDPWTMDITKGFAKAARPADLATSMLKFSWDNNPFSEYSTPFPSTSWGHFNNLRLGFTDQEDKLSRSFETATGHFNNFADWFNYFNNTQDRIRSNGQLGYFVSLGEFILHPLHKVSITSGMLSNQRIDKEPFWRWSNLTYAGNEIMLAGLHLEQTKEMINFECTPAQAAYYASTGRDCETALSESSNLGDVTIRNAPWYESSGGGGLRDLESVEGLGYTTFYANYGLNWARYYQGLNLWAKNTEVNGEMTWAALTTLIPITTEVVSTQLLSGNKLEAWEYGLRYTLGGAAVAFNASTDNPQIENALNNNGVFAVMGPTYPKPMIAANKPYDFLAFGANTYDDPTSMHQFILPPLSTGFYLYGHAWAGWNAGMAYKVGNGLEKWGPLAQAGLGLGAEFLSNAIEGDPQFYKYGLAGGVTMLGFGGLGYLFGDSPAVQNAMRFNPMIQAGPDGVYAQVELGHLFQRQTELRAASKEYRSRYD